MKNLSHAPLDLWRTALPPPPFRKRLCPRFVDLPFGAFWGMLKTKHPFPPAPVVALFLLCGDPLPSFPMVRTVHLSPEACGDSLPFFPANHDFFFFRGRTSWLSLPFFLLRSTGGQSGPWPSSRLTGKEDFARVEERRCSFHNKPLFLSSPLPTRDLSWVIPPLVRERSPVFVCVTSGH